VDPARRAERALAAAQASFQAGPSTPPGCCVPAVLGTFTGAVFIDFLGRLLRDCGGAEGAPDRGWASGAPGQAGQRLGRRVSFARSCTGICVDGPEEYREPAARRRRSGSPCRVSFASGGSCNW
jgi:hypothetical protein